jgi:hypothetical protein
VPIKYKVGIRTDEEFAHEFLVDEIRIKAWEMWSRIMRSRGLLVPTPDEEDDLDIFIVENDNNTRVIQTARFRFRNGVYIRSMI